VLQLHREFVRAGSDVLQSFTFFASDDRLAAQGTKSGEALKGSDINREGINQYIYQDFVSSVN
jgi:betaine-homocysteine S-methyltransferase